jgi:hypothetical protein
VYEVKAPEVLPRQEYLKLPPSERELYIREILRQTIRCNIEGVTVTLLANKLPFGARTIEKHLSVLVHTNEIYSVKIGNTQLFLPNSIPMHPAKKNSFETKDREYTAYMLQNKLGEFVFIQEKKKKEFTDEVGGGILVPLNDFNKFVKFLSTFKNEMKG